MLRSLVLVAGAAGLLVACSAQNEPATPEDAAPSPAPVLTPAPTPTAAPDGTALVPGSWQISEDAAGATAAYVGPDGAAVLEIRCVTATRAVTLSRAGAALAPQAIRIDAGGHAARLDMVPGGVGLTAQIEPSLPLFAAFTQPQGVIVITTADGTRSQFPGALGLRRVFGACS